MGIWGVRDKEVKNDSLSHYILANKKFRRPKDQ
jgi:hypothetical protein